MTDAHGFEEPRVVEYYDMSTVPRVWAVTGPDAEDHSITCEFVSAKGLLPCNCDNTRAKYSDWWTKWLQWALLRVESEAPGMLEPWPLVASIGITGHGPEETPEEP